MTHTNHSNDLHQHNIPPSPFSKITPRTSLPKRSIGRIGEQPGSPRAKGLTIALGWTRHASPASPAFMALPNCTRTTSSIVHDHLSPFVSPLYQIASKAYLCMYQLHLPSSHCQAVSCDTDPAIMTAPPSGVMGPAILPTFSLARTNANIVPLKTAPPARIIPDAILDLRRPAISPGWNETISRPRPL